MPIIPLNLPWEPDKGPLSTTSLDHVHNVFPLPEGWGPIPELTPYTQSLGSECKGAWGFRSDDGIANTVAATQTKLWKLTTGLIWTDISRLGTNIAVNGTFAVGTGWTLGTGVTISGGLGVFTSVADGIGMTQAQTFAAGSSYTVTYTVSGYSSGGVKPVLSGGTPVSGTVRSANGTYTDTIVAATGNTTFGLIADSSGSGGGGPTDPYIGNVVLLIGANGADGSTAFIDESPVARTLTVAGNAQIDTALVKYGTGAALFDGNGDYITAPDSADWEFPGEFTIESWYAHNGGSNGSYALLSRYVVNGERSLAISIFQSGTSRSLVFTWCSDGTNADWTITSTGWTTATIPDGTFFHWAIDRDAAGKVRLYVNGVMIGSRASSTTVNWNSTTVLNIGGSAATLSDLAGSLDEFRITKGVARYASDSGYTVPTAAFPRAPSTTLNIDNVTLQASAGYVGPPDGEMWTATRFGTNLYVTNINDPLQVTSTTGVTTFADAPGSPPQAKYVDTIGDFLFLAHLKVGAQTYPRKWQHSKINDPTNWVIDGGPGSSDDQEIPDGGNIVGILHMSGGNARIIQKSARRGLSFTPGGIGSFQQYDIDAMRGAAAPHSIVNLGSDSYFYLTDNGFVMDDAYKSIGAERVDGWFLKAVSPNRLFSVKATADPLRKIVWVTYEDPQSIRRVIGYNWFLDRWFQSDAEATVFVATISPGYVLNDLPLTLDSYPSPPLDSEYWKGGLVNFGAFKVDGKMYLFAGDKAPATIETNTMQLADGMGAYVWGAELIGNLTSFTMQHGSSFLPRGNLSWSAERTRSTITGICPFSKDAKWHRFRLNVSLGGMGTHIHGIRPYARPSSLA